MGATKEKNYNNTPEENEKVKNYVKRDDMMEFPIRVSDSGVP